MDGKRKTISELLAQTRPVTKGPRIRGKSLKCRGALKGKDVPGCSDLPFDDSIRYADYIERRFSQSIDLGLIAESFSNKIEGNIKIGVGND